MVPLTVDNSALLMLDQVPMFPTGAALLSSHGLCDEIFSKVGDGHLQQ